MTNKRSYTKEEFKQAVANSVSFSELARSLGRRPGSSNDYWRKKIIEYGLDVSHFRGHIQKLYTEQEAIKAIEDSISIAEAIRKLNLSIAQPHYDSLNTIINKHNIDTSHFRTSIWSAKELANAIVSSSSLEEAYLRLNADTKSKQQSFRRKAVQLNISTAHLIKNRRSAFDGISKQKLEQLTSESISFKEILNKIGLKGGGSQQLLKRRLNDLGIDTKHLKGQGHNKGKKFGDRSKIPLDKAMTKNSTYNRGALKQRLLYHKLLKEKCELCGLAAEWNGKKLVLRLDHKNGINNDNRLENLRLLCPNCDSQTPYFCGRNTTKKQREIESIPTDVRQKLQDLSMSKQSHISKISKQIQPQSTQVTCKNCGKMTFNSKFCSNECRGFADRHTERPAKEQLAADIDSMSFLAIGRKYGVSDNAIRKWAKKYGLPHRKRQVQ